MSRDYIILMGPWGSTGPIEVTPHEVGGPLVFPDKLPEPIVGTPLLPFPERFEELG